MRSSIRCHYRATPLPCRISARCTTNLNLWCGTFGVCTADGGIKPQVDSNQPLTHNLLKSFLEWQVALRPCSRRPNVQPSPMIYVSLATSRISLGGQRRITPTSTHDALRCICNEGSPSHP